MTRPSKPTSTLALLQEPRLRRLLIAQVPADLADWLDFVALGALVAFHWHLGAPALAAVTLALGLPYVVLIPFLGVIVDRADLRLVLVASNLGRAAATAAFAFAPNLATLLVLAALKSSADALFVPAKQAALPLVAPPDRLMAANGVSHAINQLSKLAGPALGGALIAVLAPQQVFLVNAGLSVIAALLLVGLPLRGPAPRHSAGPRSMWREFREGMALFRTRPRLTLALVAMTVGFFLIFLYDGLIVLLIREIGFSQAMFGFTIAAVGAGGAAGAIALGRYGERRNPLLLMAAGSIASGLLVAATGHVGTRRSCRIGLRLRDPCLRHRHCQRRDIRAVPHHPAARDAARHAGARHRRLRGRHDGRHGGGAADRRRSRRDGGHARAFPDCRLSPGVFRARAGAVAEASA